MNCVITGKETTLKWKNHPIDRDLLGSAKMLVTEGGFGTLRDAILHLQKEWRKAVNTKVVEIIKAKNDHY